MEARLTVRELIEKLSKCDQELEVVVFSSRALDDKGEELDDVEAHLVIDAHGPHIWEFPGGKKVFGLEIARNLLHPDLKGAA